MAALPWVVLIVGSGLRLVEAELEEQALLDGSPRQVFFRVTLHGALPAIGVAALWTAIVAAGEMTVTDLFAVRTYAEEVYTRHGRRHEPGDILLAALPGTSSWRVGGGRTGPFRQAGAAESARRPRQPWVFRWAGSARPPCYLSPPCSCCSWCVPLGNLLYKAGVLVTQTDAGRLRSWSPVKCFSIIWQAPWRNRREFGWSLLIAPVRPRRPCWPPRPWPGGPAAAASACPC